MSISKNKLLYHADRLAGDYRPITADVFITNYCNLKCDFCTYNRWELDENSTYMRFEDFKAYAERLLELGVKGIILTGGGEPTINKDFDKITAWLEENKIHYGINTNGVVFKKIKPDYIKVSLDGYDKQSYIDIKGVDRFDEARNTIRQFAEWKKEHSPNTALGVQKIVVDYEEIEKFYEANKDLDFDYMVFRPMESTQGKFYADVSARSIFSSIRTIKRLQEKDNRVVMNYKWAKLHTTFDICEAHWSQIALNERGEVIYCCHKPYEIVGHILDDDILQKYSEAKTNMSMCDVPCRLTAPNEFMRELRLCGNSGDANFI